MMSSQSCMVPSWNLRNQKQLQQDKAVEVEQGQQGRVNTPQVNSQHHHHRHQNTSPILVPKPNYEVAAELTWENGQLAMHGLGGILPPTVTPQTSKLTWGRIGDTLESFVLQATCQNQLSVPKQNDNPNAGNMSSMVASSSNKWGDSSGQMQVAPSFLKKRVRSSAISIDSGRNVKCSVQGERNHPDMSASASATVSKDNDTTMMTWPSFESPNWSFKSKATDDDDVSENQGEDRNNKGETTRSHSARPSRAAAVHNQSERRRRDRINQKMKALQKLVPNASKTDKASMLDEVIEYLKNLQSQVQMMNSVRTTMPAAAQMLMPAAALQQMQQQQLQMSMLAARMGMGMGMGTVGLGMGIGMGMMPQSLSPSTSHSFVPPQFVMSQMIQSHAASQAQNGAQAPNTSVPFADPYSTFLAQNMDMYSKMATLYRQRQAAQSTASPSGSKGES